MNQEKNIPDIKPYPNTLTPFKLWCLQNFPYIEADFDAITNYQLLCKISEYLNQVIANQNVVENNVTQAINYINNLNFQDEVNTKIDELINDGTFDKIINQELLNNLDTRVNLLDNKKFLFMGDSYAQGYNPDGNVTGWPQLIKTYLGLSDSNCVIKYRGGYAFYGGSGTFTSLLNELENDNTITDIVLCAGYNDRTHTQEEILNGMISFKNLVQTKFPNAKIHFGFIGWSNIPEQLFSLQETYIKYQQSANSIGIEIYPNIEYSLHNYSNFFASDGYHPNALGQINIAKNIINCLLTGSCDVKYNYRNISITNSGSCTSITGNTNGFGSYIDNGITTISSQSLLSFYIDNLNYILNGETDIEVATINDSNVIGCNFKINNIPISAYLQDGNLYYKCDGLLLIYNRKIYLRFIDINNENNNFRTLNAINKITIMPFTTSVSTMLI